MYEYKCTVTRVVDGDTVDIDIDLGFGVVLTGERVRVQGIDAPESRTSDEVTRIFGALAKHRVQELLTPGVRLLSTEFMGKYGRLLGDFVLPGGDTLTGVLLRERLAVPYTGGSKAEITAAHLLNREFLIYEGLVTADEIATATALNESKHRKR